MGYLDFVDLLLEEEVGLREGRRFRNALKLSGLPHHKTLDQFDFAFQPGLDARKVRDLATLEFVQAKSNVALLGPPGVGKTMLAVALAVGACQAGLSIYFTTLDDLVRRLRAAEATGRFNRQLQTYLRPAVLVGRPMPDTRLCQDRGLVVRQSAEFWSGSSAGSHSRGPVERLSRGRRPRRRRANGNDATQAGTVGSHMWRLTKRPSLDRRGYTALTALKCEGWSSQVGRWLTSSASGCLAAVGAAILVSVPGGSRRAG